MQVLYARLTKTKSSASCLVLLAEPFSCRHGMLHPPFIGIVSNNCGHFHMRIAPTAMTAIPTQNATQSFVIPVLLIIQILKATSAPQKK